jgi:hypothetical protein
MPLAIEIGDAMFARLDRQLLRSVSFKPIPAVIVSGFSHAGLISRPDAAT